MPTQALNSTVYTTDAPTLDESPEEPPAAAPEPVILTPILSNVILAIDDDVQSVPAAPETVPEHSEVLFDDIQPSDIVTLPDPLPDDDGKFMVREPHSVLAAAVPADILSATPPPSAILTDEIQQT